MARPRKPDSLRELHGQKPRSSGRPVDPLDPRPPRGLSARARALWKYYAPLLVAAGGVDARDRDTLARYVVNLALVEELQREHDASADQVQRWRLRRDARATDNTVRQLGRELGLTVLARQGVSFDPPKPDDGYRDPERLLT